MILFGEYSPMLNKSKKQLLSIPGVSLLSFTDEDQMRLSFPKDSVQYARSFLYLLRASHGEKGTLGYKYLSTNLTAVIGVRNSIIYLTPITDVTQGIHLQQLCQKIVTKTHCRVLIKKFSPEAYPYMKRIRQYRHKEKELEDEAYPETVLNLPRLFVNQKGEINPSETKFIKQIRRFNRLGIKFKIVNKITPTNLIEIERLLKIDLEKYSNYLPIVNYLYTHEKDIKYKIMMFMYDDKIEGIYIVEIFSLTDSGLYCAVTAKNRPGITEWMDWYFFQKLYSEGIKTVYFGGSETKGVAYYIKKLNPINPSYFVETIEYDSRLNPAQTSLKTHTFKQSILKKTKKITKKIKSSYEITRKAWSRQLSSAQ